MYIIGNLFSAIASILDFLIQLYMLVILARVIMSWVNPNPGNPLVQYTYRLTEPPLAYIRQFVPDLGGLDISPIILLAGLYFIQNFVIKSLYQMALNLQ